MKKDVALENFILKTVKSFVKEVMNKPFVNFSPNRNDQKITHHRGLHKLNKMKMTGISKERSQEKSGKKKNKWKKFSGVVMPHNSIYNVIN